MKTLADAIEKTVRNILIALAGDFPADGICHHLGIQETAKYDGVRYDVGVDFLHNDTNVLLKIYSPDYIDHDKIELGTERQAAILAAVLRIAPLKESWNGRPRHDGGSFVIAMKVPSSLFDAIGAYRKLANVFDTTEAETARFRSWTKAYKSNYKKACRNNT